MQGKQLEVDIMRGLIMEGGAMRGMFTCGVIDVFMEQGIEFDGAAGISAGAVFGCNIKSRQIGRPIRYNKKYCKDPRYCSIRSLLKTGDLYGVEFCYHELPDVLDPFDQDMFRENAMDFYVGATDVNTLLDGGIACPVPYRFMEKKGYDRNVIILTQPEGYRKTKSPSALQAMLRRYPAISRAMGKRHIIYNRQMEQIEERERQGKAFVIRPPEDLKIGRTEKDPEELERVYQIGRRIASDASEKIRRFLSETTAG